jgi:DNA-directed RNA polymerase specialized sigma24 family protein
MTADEILRRHLERIAAAGHVITPRDVRDAIAQLPDRQAEAMQLRWVAGVTNKTAIARRMGISDKNVHKLLAKGFVGLLGILGAKYPDVEFVTPSPPNPES